MVYTTLEAGQSFIKRTKNNGPKTKSWGIPETIDFIDNFVFLPELSVFVGKRFLIPRNGHVLSAI